MNGHRYFAAENLPKWRMAKVSVFRFQDIVHFGCYAVTMVQLASHSLPQIVCCSYSADIDVQSKLSSAA